MSGRWLSITPEAEREHEEIFPFSVGIKTNARYQQCAYLAGFRGAGRLGKWEGPASTLPPISTTPLVLAWLDDHILPLTCACITVKKDLPV